MSFIVNFFFSFLFFFFLFFFFFQAEDGIRDVAVTGVQTCALPISALTAPVKFTSKTRGQSSGSRFQNGNPNLPEPTPAAYTRWSHRPNWLWTEIGRASCRERV